MFMDLYRMSYTHKVIYSYITVYNSSLYTITKCLGCEVPPDTQPKEIAALPKPNVAGAAKSSSEDVLRNFSNRCKGRTEGATFPGSSPAVGLNLF